MVLHIREMIHRVGSLNRFKNIVNKALAAETSGKDLGFDNLKTMQGGQHGHAAQIVPQNSQYDTINSL
jgi:hypothetical protein